VTSVLVDTSVWIDHLHRPDDELLELLRSSAVVVHPMVVCELALGTIKDRPAILGALAGLRSITAARHIDVMHLVDQRGLFGRGLSLVDAHLLASTLVAEDVALLTRDKRLKTACDDLGIAYDSTSR
jgi:predicted nucleic acid-binding protein